MEEAFNVQRSTFNFKSGMFSFKFIYARDSTEKGNVDLVTFLIMVIHLAAVLGQENALGTLNALAHAPTPSSCEILTPRTRVSVDHQL